MYNFLQTINTEKKERNNELNFKNNDYKNFKDLYEKTEFNKLSDDFKANFIFSNLCGLVDFSQDNYKNNIFFDPNNITSFVFQPISVILANTYSNDSMKINF